VNRKDKRTVVNNWTSHYAEVFQHNRWQGNLTFPPSYMAAAVLYTKTSKVRGDVIDSAYNIVLGRVLTIVGQIETEKRTPFIQPG
jgi:hypothetical protein